MARENREWLCICLPASTSVTEIRELLAQDWTVGYLPDGGYLLSRLFTVQTRTKNMIAA